MLLLTLNADLNTVSQYSGEVLRKRLHAQHKDDGKGCRRDKYCKWYKTSCHKVLDTRGQALGDSWENSLRSEALSTL